MRIQTAKHETENYYPETPGLNGIDSLIGSSSQDEHCNSRINDLLTEIATVTGKKSFLVFKQNKYFTVPVNKIAFFYMKFESTIIRSFDGQEYVVNCSLEQIQTLVNDKQFFRLNRQYLINFYSVKEAEHFYGRKMIVSLIVPANDPLLISKEKVSGFLHWLDNR